MNKEVKTEKMSSLINQGAEILYNLKNHIRKISFGLGFLALITSVSLYAKVNEGDFSIKKNQSNISIIDSRKNILNKLHKEIKVDSLSDKLTKVNNYWNSYKYKTDISNWKVNDYWATPMEFLHNGAGDCEDYAIAKYFSLIEGGISPEHLKITYVKKSNEPHMVLLYQNEQMNDPVVLDNVNKQILLLKTRTDLKVVYAFNENNIYSYNGDFKKELGSISKFDTLAINMKYEQNGNKLTNSDIKVKDSLTVVSNDIDELTISR